MNARPTLNNPKRSKASLIILILLALLLLTAAVFLAASIPEETVLPDTTAPIETAPLANTGFDCDASEAQHLYPFGDGIVKLTNNRLAFLALDGSEIFAQEIDMASPFSVASGDRLLAADREGNSFVVLSPDGVLYTGNREGRIVGAAFNQDDTLALIEDRHNSTGVVAILDPVTGLLQYECFFPESGYVLSVNFTPDGQAFDVVLVNTDGAAIKPLLKRFTLLGEPSGQRMFELEGIFPQVVYDQTNQPVLCSFSQLAGLTYQNETLRYTNDMARIEAVATTSDDPVVLAGTRTSGKLLVYSLGTNGQLTIGGEVGDQVTPLAVSSHFVAFGSSTHVYVFDAATAKLVLDNNLANEIVRVGFASPTALTVVTATGVRQLTVQTD
ncbi:MAG: DUF5711 family protein [Eubacteriales bacterium]|nr:DUF5711 family protein [Eubacteriales bacterium]